MRRTKSHAAVFPFDDCHAPVGYWDGMDVERIIDEIERLQEMFETPDIRPLGASDLRAANRRPVQRQNLFMFRIVATFALVILAISQRSKASTVVPHTAQSKQESSSPPPTYTNDALGFSYTYPPQLIPNTAEIIDKMRALQKDPAHGTVIFSAFEVPTPGEARENVVILTEDVSIHGANWDEKSCLRSFTKTVSQQGWTVLRQDTPETFGGHKFLRTDFERGKPVVFQSAVCTIWKGKVLQFFLSAGSEENVNRLFRSLDTIRFQSVPSDNPTAH